MLTKKTPDTIKATLTIKAQGVENNLILTYHNQTPEAFEAFVANAENFKVPDTIEPNSTKAVSHINAAFVLFTVKSFDDGTADEFPLTRDGLMDLDRHWPGMLAGIVRGYHQARGAAVEKN